VGWASYGLPGFYYTYLLSWWARAPASLILQITQFHPFQKHFFNKSTS
jgi:hypothetical protein